MAGRDSRELRGNYIQVVDAVGRDGEVKALKPSGAASAGHGEAWEPYPEGHGEAEHTPFGAEDMLP